MLLSGVFAVRRETKTRNVSLKYGSTDFCVYVYNTYFVYSYWFTRVFGRRGFGVEIAVVVSRYVTV